VRTIFSNDYYDLNADSYIASTLNLDMREHYSRFLKYLPLGSKILDLGSGSGRDSLYFINRGYDVIAIDSSKAMVKATSELTGLEARLISIQELDYLDYFDGIWASASLVHVPKAEMSFAFSLIRRALKERGILYCSFKNREKDFFSEGRLFSCYTPPLFEEFLNSLNSFTPLEMVTSPDLRPERSGESWLNLILQTK
jgi:SAM-dependent methyltransferase